MLNQFELVFTFRAITPVQLDPISQMVRGLVDREFPRQAFTGGVDLILKCMPLKCTLYPAPKTPLAILNLTKSKDLG